MSQTTKDFLHLHILVMVWGFTAILGKLISLPSVELVFHRTLLAAFGLLIVVFFRKKPFRISHRGDFLLIALVGLLIAAHWILFFLAARISNISVCLAGMASASIWTGLFEPMRTKKRLRPYELMISAMGFIGMAVIFQSELQYGIGFLVAILSALLAGIFMVLNAELAKKQDPYTITFYEMIFANIGILLFMPFYSFFIVGDWPQLLPEAKDWFYLVILAWMCTVYAYSASVELMRRISAFAVNITVNLEPIYGILLALWIFGEEEKMTSGFYIGTAIILLSVLIYPPLNKMMQRRALGTDLLR